jgi:hypothetical protein
MEILILPFVVIGILAIPVILDDVIGWIKGE